MEGRAPAKSGCEAVASVGPAGQIPVVSGAGTGKSSTRLPAISAGWNHFVFVSAGFCIISMHN